MENTFYYDLLDISPDADQQEIADAYRGKKQAWELRGKKFRGMNAREITTAYEILSDPEKRKAYDKERTKPVKTMEQLNQEMIQLGEELNKKHYGYIPLDDDGKDLLRRRNQLLLIFIAFLAFRFLISLIRVLVHLF